MSEIEKLFCFMCCAVLSCSVMSDSLRPPGLDSARLLCPWNSPGNNTGVGYHALLQGIFPTQGSNPGLPHCRQILYWLSHQGSPFCFIGSVQLLDHVRLFATPWTVARQASLSITNPWNLLKLMSIKSVMPSNHLILCRPLLLPPSIFSSIRVFSNKTVLHIRWPKYWISASVSVLPMNIQDWFPLGWTGWISLRSKGLSRVFSNTTIQKHQLFGAQLSL